MPFSKKCYPVDLFHKGCLEVVCPSFFHLSSCSCLFFQRFLLGYLFSKGFYWATFFSTGFSWATFFPKVSCGAPFFQRLFWSNLFSKGLLFGLSTGCLGSNAASFVCQLLQFFHCVLYLLHFVASFLKHSF